MRVNRRGCVAGWLHGLVCVLGVAAVWGAWGAVPAAYGQLVPGFYVLEGANGENVTVAGISADGTTIGGDYLTTSARRAAKWRIDGGTVVREDFGGETQTVGVRNISADGSTLVGLTPGSGFDTSSAVRVRADGAIQDLGMLGGYVTHPETPLGRRAFRWTQGGGMQYLPDPNGSIDTTAVDMTPDGSVIAGYGYTNTTKAMVWRNGVPEYLGTVPGTNFGTSYANSISDDGNVVVGNTDVPGGVHAVRWVGNEPEVLVTSAFAVTSNAWATNADGSLIGGNVLLPGSGIRPTDAFLWTAESGPIFARDYFAMHGIDIPVGTRLRAINAISADGTVFSGGLRTAGGQDISFVVVVPAPPVMLLALIAVPCVARRRVC